MCGQRKKKENVRFVEEEGTTLDEETGLVKEVRYLGEIPGRPLCNRDDEENLYGVYRTEVCKESPILINVCMGNSEVKMELDMGASITVAGQRELKRAIGKLPRLDKTEVRLKTYGGKVIEPLGVLEMPVSYNGQLKTLPIVVTSEPGPMLMGRNWLRELQLDWRGIMADIFPVAVEERDKESNVESVRLKELLKEFSDVFSE